MNGSAASAVLVVIPAYNEADSVGTVVTAARRYLPVLVVDDGSTDATATVAAAAGATVLSQQPNQGKGAALRAGFRHALATGYEAVITLDADGQHDPDEIPRFLDCYATTQADLIIGARAFNRMPPVRRLANTLGRLAFSWAAGRSIPDNQSGYRLLARRLLERALAGRETGFEFEVEVIVLCLEAGYRLEWVPIRTLYAGETSHIRPLHHVIHFTRLVWQTRRRRRRA
jgi:glycosyltransferase involved in cell wall biosynthesis